MRQLVFVAALVASSALSAPAFAQDDQFKVVTTFTVIADMSWAGMALALSRFSASNSGIEPVTYQRLRISPMRLT